MLVSQTITAQVVPNTRGQGFAVKTAISVTETVEITETVDDVKTVQEYELPVAETNSSNDMDTDTISIAIIPNVDPMFQVTRSVPENSPDETTEGDLIKVKEPNSGDTLTFSLTGEGADQFTASSVSGGAQIAMANGADLDYETKQSHKLTLGSERPQKRRH